MTAQKYPIVTVTGTKGKTSLVRILDFVLREMGEHVARVDTSGAFYDGALRFTDEQSRERWGYAVTNVPGRFMTLHGNTPGITLLEATLFSARTGLGYKRHDVGIFTNVYDDHIGSFPNISSREDIANLKSFVFKRIREGGVAIYNADDVLVRAQLAKLPAETTTIAVSTSAKPQPAVYSCVLDGAEIVVYRGKDVQHRFKLNDFAWLAPEHVPSVYLLLFAVAGLQAIVPNRVLEAVAILKNYMFDPEGGRMVRLPMKNGATLLMDYAHESMSLQAVAEYARSLALNGKVWGVLRLAPSRSERLVRETAEAIYAYYDEFVVYDKVDGYFRKPQIVKGYSGKQEETGRMAALFSNALKQEGKKPVETIVREDKAVQYAIAQSQQGDVIVYVVGDDPARSKEFVAANVRNEL